MKLPTEPDIDVEVRLPWKTICMLAVQARCMNLDLNTLCNMALQQALDMQPKKKGRKK